MNRQVLPIVTEN